VEKRITCLPREPKRRRNIQTGDDSFTPATDSASPDDYVYVPRRLPSGLGSVQQPTGTSPHNARAVATPERLRDVSQSTAIDPAPLERSPLMRVDLTKDIETCIEEGRLVDAERALGCLVNQRERCREKQTLEAIHSIKGLALQGQQDTAKGIIRGLIRGLEFTDGILAPLMDLVSTLINSERMGAPGPSNASGTFSPALNPTGGSAIPAGDWQQSIIDGANMFQT
jgi:hypothetical protein